MENTTVGFQSGSGFHYPAEITPTLPKITGEPRKVLPSRRGAEGWDRHAHFGEYGDKQGAEVIDTWWAAPLGAVLAVMYFVVLVWLHKRITRVHDE